LNTPPQNVAPQLDTLPRANDSPPPTRPSTLRWVFFGDDGLRAGWGLLVFIAIFAALSFCINFTLRRLGVQRPDPAAEMSPMVGILGEASTFLLVLFVTWIMSKIERRPQSVYGFGDNRKLRHFLTGLGWGFVCLSVLIGTLMQTGFLVIDRRLLFGGDVLRYGAIWFLGFVFVGLVEEYLTRGYVQYTLTRGLSAIYERLFKTRNSAAFGFWTSAIIFSFLFGLGHSKNPGESPIGLWSAGLAGMGFLS
jgi:membrane protease YdiL (CAAX protease family)